MPLRPPNPFADLEDTDYWEDVGIDMRLRLALGKTKSKWNLPVERKIRKVRYMNPFQHHGISHLSPSSVNMFAESGSAWIVRYLLGHRFPSGAAMWRGIAVEEGLSQWVFGKATAREASHLAIDKFDELKGSLNIDEKVESERRRLDRYVVNAMDAMLELQNEFGIGEPQMPPLGQTFNGQWEVSLPCRFDTEDANGKVDVIGYLDFLYANDANKHTIVDLKTTARIPSEMPDSHRQQAAFYKRAHGSNPDVFFVYASPKEEGKPNPFNIIKLDDESYHRSLNQMKDSIKRMANFLRLSDDPFVLAGAIPHNEGSFYWTGEPKTLDDIVSEKKLAIENTEEK